MKYRIKKIGEGVEGTIFQIGNSVFKVYKKNYHSNVSVNETLKELDPSRTFFMWYDIIKPQFVLMKKLKPLRHPKLLTKLQYRHLQKALNILHQNKIFHGDLPDNVMLDPLTDMPIIIDFDQGHLKASPIELEIDRRAFLSFFAKKIEKF